jgi:hypothetical protein
MITVTFLFFLGKRYISLSITFETTTFTYFSELYLLTVIVVMLQTEIYLECWHFSHFL